ncbi:phosphotransferase [Deinococcus yavapaiensis]|uniref:Phosphotransferase family enzyme n=1 Tax=Deinococcus yavapaiensis KR-236 TaxID=694435 RepID=A0A318RZ22_9DEIO|nr:phosphotransferase [Deinococcus yavapaiensis]PYE48370.1 phosphotransferase family enzyme [Deinococcus yavapaiensis KR-236]
MTSSNLAVIQALHPTTLTHVLRQHWPQQPFEVTDFTADVLSHQGVTSHDTLFLLQGHALTEGTLQPWSLVLKTFEKLDAQQQSHDLWALTREYEAYHSNLLSNLPGPVRVPRAYALTERGDQRWLWLEYVRETTPTWTLETYAHAARQLGAFNGAYLTGTPLPDAPWLLRNLVEQWSTMFAPTSAWQAPLVRQFFPPDLQANVLRLWDERTVFYQALRSLPQVFSHFDFHRRNLLVRHEEIVAVDWAWCGHGAVGGDVVSLVGSTCMLGEWDVEEIEVLEGVVFEAYLEGLRIAGWRGDASVVRLGYAAWLALHFGLVGPTLTAVWTLEDRQVRATELFGGTPEELAGRWSVLTEFSLRRAEEARALLRIAQPYTDLR